MINIIHELGTPLDQPVKWGDREISEIREFFPFELEEKHGISDDQEMGQIGND